MVEIVSIDEQSKINDLCIFLIDESFITIYCI